MENITYESVLNEVATEAGDRLRKLLYAIKPLYKENSPVPNEIQYSLVQLYSSLIETVDSLILLISFGHIWDAKLLGRVVAEGTLKFLYIFKGSDKEMLLKLDEYLNIIPSINRIRISNTSGNLLNRLNFDPQKGEALSDSLLGEEEIKRFNGEYSNKEQKRILGKWSNKGLLESLKDDVDTNLYISLIYDYKLSSQIAHIDADILEYKKAFNEDILNGIYTGIIMFGANTLANSLTLLLICTLRFLNLQGIDSENIDRELANYHSIIVRLHSIAVEETIGQ